MTNLLAPSYEKDEAKALWYNPIKPTASLAFVTEKQSQQSCQVSVSTRGAGLHIINEQFLTGLQMLQTVKSLFSYASCPESYFLRALSTSQDYTLLVTQKDEQ